MDRGSPVARKVPAITAHFWVIKILTTAMGEATSDYLVHTFNPYLVVSGGFVAFAIAMAIQFSVGATARGRIGSRSRWSRSSGRWRRTCSTSSSVFPTSSRPCCSPSPWLRFSAWYRSERTLSIHSIFTRRRETFYWAAVLATFAMGTAAGDSPPTRSTSASSRRACCSRRFLRSRRSHTAFSNGNAIFAFWFAYVMTRPLGASFADWFGVPQSLGGLNYGRGTVAVGLTIAIVAWVGFLWVTKVDVERVQGAPRRAPQAPPTVGRSLRARSRRAPVTDS